MVECRTRKSKVLRTHLIWGNILLLDFCWLVRVSILFGLGGGVIISWDKPLVLTPLNWGSHASLNPDKQSSYCCSRAHTPEIEISLWGQIYYDALRCPDLCFAKCGDTFHCCDGVPSTTTPPPTTTAPPPPSPSGGGGCFPSTARTKLRTGRLVTMSELQIGDEVQTGMKLLI